MTEQIGLQLTNRNSEEFQMNYAKFEDSERLQRVHAFLADGLPHTTREILLEADIAAVSPAVSELRANGAVIDCQRQDDPDGRPRWYYTMTTPITPRKAA